MQAMQGFRVSPQQRHLWEVAQDSPQQCSQCALLIEGELDQQLLRNLINGIVARHEILRTGFYRQPGLKVPLQVINEKATYSWKEIDLQRETPQRAEEKLERELLKQRESGDTRSGAPLNAMLFCLGPRKHVLSLALPLVSCDALSFVCLVADIASGLTKDGATSEPEEVIQYLQFSEWQNELLQEEGAKAGVEYWNTLHRRTLPAFELPFTSTQNAWGRQIARTSRSFAGELLNSLEIAAVQCGSSMDAFLLAAWQVLLWRLSGVPEIRVGCVCDGRKFSELEHSLGVFASVLPIQLHFEEGIAFSEVLRRVRHRWDESLGRQEYFFLSDAGQASETRWPAMFESTAWPFPQSHGEFRISLHSCAMDADPFLIKLLCRRDRDQLTLELAFDPSAIQKEFAENMLEQFAELLADAAESPSCRIEELRLRSAADNARIHGLCQTARGWGDTRDVIEMFNAWALKTPQADALVFENHVLTFSGLNTTSTRLSWHLAAKGVQPEARVLLLLPRSELMVVSLLAVLKAGGAYIPVEPATPPARLQFLIQETGAKVVITVESLLSRVDGAGITVVVLDRDQQIINSSEPAAAPLVEPENIAYILFTSGSTGKPKGVAIERRQLHNYVSGALEKLQMRPGSRLAMVSTFAADLGHTVLFPALCGGGCLHIVAAEQVTDADAVGGYLERNKIDFLKIVPSHFSALLSAASQGHQMIPQGALIFGGEALSWSLVDHVLEVAPECRILNHYGPTETTVGVMTHETTAHRESRWGATAPLGKPLPNVQLYVLDGQQRHVPTGVPGELYIGGLNVSRGYWNRPELTAERYLPDPWASRPGDRMYRTGDTVRLLPDGTLDYVGRLDRQIKLRGYRVEPGEIEAAILEQAGVQQAAVELIPSATTEEQLVAFVGAGKNQNVTAEHLRNCLSSVLPDQMVPAVFVILESLPLTVNGKIDRQSLKLFENVEKKDAEYISPREMGEELLAGVWREVLGVPRVGIRDNFFALGGDSLIATQLISRVRKLFQIELPVRMVFEAPTVGAMAAKVEEALRGRAQMQSPPILPVPRDGELVLSFGQERLWGIQQLDPQNYAYNSVLSLRLTGPLKKDALVRALNEIVRRHEVLRTTFALTDGRPRQVIHPPVVLEMPQVSLRMLQGDELEVEIKRQANDHWQRPFDLEHGPLLRFKLLSVEENTNILLVCMHHIVTDGWSQNVLTHELITLYDAYCGNLPSPLPELPIQYGDFAAWQKKWLQGQVLDDLLEYWKDNLAGAPELLNFPTDYPRPKRPSYRGSCVVWQHSQQQLAQLKQLGRSEGVTLFMTLLATYYVFLYRYTGQDDIVVGTDIANRNHAETESLIGFFVNNLPLRVSLSGNPTFRELLNRVRTSALGAYSHQDLPFATLVKALQPKRSLSHTPIFQTLFVLQATPAVSSAPKELEAAPIDADLTTSKFDLALMLAESGEELIAYWTYRTELFRPETIMELGKDFNRILASIPQHLDSPLTSLIETERKQNHGKTFRLSSKTLYTNQEKLDPGL